MKDPTAQDLLWEYAQRRRTVDAAFSDDLEAALKIAGYTPTGQPRVAMMALRGSNEALRGENTKLRARLMEETRRGRTRSRTRPQSSK